ncbi:MAG: class I SAM-dependent methyltransferase, partial [Prolixibacteraceae bacterium]|nr:class I SAM-dependent methyltransferase [Burkholderiales bacterium]
MLTGLVRKMMSSMGSRVDGCFRLQFADGTHYQNRDGAPAFTIIMRRRRAQWRILLFGHIGLLESYFDADVDVDGDLGAAFRTAFDGAFEHDPNVLVRLRNRWHELRFSNRSIAQARANARFHYAIGTEFYRYWLDSPLMMYTCGYWKEGTTTVDEAQVNKVDHVCRKIKLSHGESVIDIGCGFGGFMFHAQERYGAIPHGLNTTPEQVTAVQEEIRRRGLEGSMDVRLADFREVDRQYDKVVSIGVLEHAGRDQLAEVVQAHADFLKPGGLGMLHFIGHFGDRDTEFYIREHVFPGGWIPSLAQTIAQMERCGLEIVDIENLRRHYAPTLDAWAERFDRNWESIRALDPGR